ncbi:hypothetical protein [Kouleothrix sp.]|uniref:hypothetical protein n=1 Tax=Kouleothrix sp. TaxID=2779161 RepID=UPI003919F1FF
MPLDQVNLEALLLQDGDFPAGIRAVDAKTNIPPLLNVAGVYSDITPAQRDGSTSFQLGGDVIGGSVVYLYAKPEDRQRAYLMVLEGLTKARSLGTVGEAAMITVLTGALSATEKLSGKTYTMVDIAFQRCHAVGYIRLRTTGDVEQMAKAYAQKLDTRLQAAVC